MDCLQEFQLAGNCLEVRWDDTYSLGMEAIRVGALTNRCHELKKETLKQKASLFCGRLFV